MASTKLKGREMAILLERDGKMVPVCCSRELSISIASDIKEATKAPQSDWKSFYYGDKGYTVTSGGLQIIDESFTELDFFAAMNNKQTLAFVAMSDEDSEVFYSGKLLISGINISANNREAVTYNITATGDGPLERVNPYEINILVDEDGNPLEDGEGNIIVEYESGDLLPINYDINC